MTELALVTGGARRLGKAFALSLAQLGYTIALHYHSAENEVQQTADEICELGVPVYPIHADLADVSAISSLFATIDSTPHTLKVMVNSAAFMPNGNASTLSLEDWDMSLDLNLRAPFFLAQEAAKRMTDGGLIVNITDVGAQKTWSRYPSYTVSKAALESLTKILARALAPAIRVNAIAPGLVLQSDIVTPEEWERLISRVPLKRPARTDELTSALEFLIRNEYITGQTIVVDGGYSLV